MNRTLARLMTRLYPRRWRERYGAEFEAHLEEDADGLRTVADVICSAVRERMFPTQGGTMERDPISFRAIVKHPSAFLPIAMSLAALTMLLGYIAFNGPVPETNGQRPDEGAIAHIWQLLMAGQLPVLLFFAVKWLRRAPKQALGVLALQAGAVLASMAPVFYFNL